MHADGDDCSIIENVAALCSKHAVGIDLQGVCELPELHCDVLETSASPSFNVDSTDKLSDVSKFPAHWKFCDAKQAQEWASHAWSEITADLPAKWKSLSASRKKPWKRRARERQRESDVNIAHWIDSLRADRPPDPVSAFNLWVAEFEARVRAEIKHCIVHCKR